jgi:hypothetical protein
VDHYQKADRESRSEPELALVNKMAYLNLLYHIAMPQSLPFLRKLLERQEPEKAKARAKMALDRILTLHPESR